MVYIQYRMDRCMNFTMNIEAKRQGQKEFRAMPLMAKLLLVVTKVTRDVYVTGSYVISSSFFPSIFLHSIFIYTYLNILGPI